MMQQPMPGQMPAQPQQQPTGDVEGKLKSMRSPFNPQDMAMMMQDGDIGPNSTVRDFLEKLGVNVDGPISQLAEMFKSGMQNADPLSKMRSLNQQPQGQAEQPQGNPPGRPPMVPPGSLDRLLQGQ